MFIKDILTKEQIDKYGLENEAKSIDETVIEDKNVVPANNPLLDELTADEDISLN